MRSKNKKLLTGRRKYFTDSKEFDEKKDRMSDLIQMRDNLNEIIQLRMHYEHLPIEIKHSIDRSEKHIDKIYQYIITQYDPYNFGGPVLNDGNIFFNTRNIARMEQGDEIREKERELVDKQIRRGLLDKQIRRGRGRIKQEPIVSDILLNNKQDLMELINNIQYPTT